MSALLQGIAEAHRGIRPQVMVTPLYASHGLSAALGCEVLLKAEHLHAVGSFKIRGATNKIRVLDDSVRRAGVVSASSGNHGQGVARAGALAGVRVTVYVAASAAAQKVDAMRALGADVVVIDGPPIAAEIAAREVAHAQGATYISPYNDLDVVAGQGTIGCEIAEQSADLDAVFVAVGGGGLIGGIGTALKHLRPRTRIVGVWPENSPCMLAALRAGHVVETPECPTLSDGTAGGIEEGSITLAICQQVIDETVTVTEAEIAAAMRAIAEKEHWIVEGAAGVAMAGLIRAAKAYQGRRVAAVICGRNIGLEQFRRAIA